jgi:hypothetical protein
MAKPPGIFGSTDVDTRLREQDRCESRLFGMGMAQGRLAVLHMEDTS